MEQANNLMQEYRDLRDLANLEEHPGWPLLLEELDGYAQELLRQLEEELDPTRGLRLADAWRMMRKSVEVIKNAPERAKTNWSLHTGLPPEDMQNPDELVKEIMNVPQFMDSMMPSVPSLPPALIGRIEEEFGLEN